MEMTWCPQCSLVAEVLLRDEWPSTDGPVQHAHVRCITGHRFVLPVSMLPASAAREPVTSPHAVADPVTPQHVDLDGTPPQHVVPQPATLVASAPAWAPVAGWTRPWHS